MMNERQLERMREKLETLVGERGNKAMSAVRRGEILPLAQVGMQSQQITGAPTADDFNALQQDMANLYEALTKISNVLGNASTG